MFQSFTLIPTTFIIICLLANQAVSKTADVDKLWDKTSVKAKKWHYLSSKNSKLTSKSTPKLIYKYRNKNLKRKTLSSQLLKNQGLELIANSKTFPPQKNITHIQTQIQNLSHTQQKLTHPQIINTLTSKQPIYAQNTPTNQEIRQNLPDNPRPDPNRDRFLQPLPQPTQPEEPKEEELKKSPPPQPLPDEPTQKIPVQRILVLGSTILTPEEINSLTRPLEGRLVTLLELRQIADQITEIYLERGYITSRAILPPQTITEGAVRIQVIEGILGEVQIEGTKRLHKSYIENRIRLGAGQPLDTAQLENQLRLLRGNPLFENIEASLRASENPGESILIVRVTEANPFEFSINTDNYSPPTVGSERVGSTLLHRNLTGRGDFFVVSYNTTRLFSDESDVFDFIYNLPINSMNGTLQFRAAPNSNRIGQDFEGIEISGTTDVYEFSYRQPFLRTPREELAFSVGLSYQRTETFLDDQLFDDPQTPEEDGVNSTTVIRLGQDYIRRDPQGAWALRSQFNIGTNLFDATEREDPQPDGRFFSWLGQVQRVQRLSANHLLIVQGDLQLSSIALLPYQQFIIGGGLSLRGYRQNIRSGDNGFRFSIEDRITVYRDESGLPSIQFTPFIDIGAVWNDGSNPNNDSLPDQRFLAGAGIGLIWQPLPQVDLRLDYGIPLVDLDDRGNNAQDSGFYFSVIFRPL
ncbi:ShlB/FhaC/HecB family hemolysin secretion/activation protein [Okeania sp. SIO1I7]|uniref:ShlB/FhaC/HecB family hemolysin secretion/activation protein n=1 Tax=Okeania sp. SIO1I7 TaxID=2607772 RepID=UPI0013F7248C|nr:ShlB/FhaC/HecB family hemolysin secretion/activation protein [Okeania sp. SIO1I7]NET25502.1 ShlB/FhaC/HecB family hemolysin secretion/activation protein [Okeania sp. SIO1I7]